MPSLASFFRKRCIRLFAIAAFTVAAFGTIHADPITVVGSATLVNGAFFGPAITFNISGQNFQAFNIEDPGGLDHFGNFGISPCSRSVAPLNGGPCTSANLGYTGNGSDLDGMFTVNGQTFVSDVINTLSFQITSPTFVIPPELLNEPSLLITAPFVFTGMAGGACCQVVDLSGQGTVTLLLTRQTVGGFTGLFLQNAQYVFGETVPGVTIQTEVPEPTTMVLLLSGLAGAIVRLRHKANRSR
jgi:PEP-CTERM motif-containing protein